jgi:hypothetical protein
MGMLVDIPIKDVIHMPSKNAYRYILCPEFNAAKPATSCRFGLTCTLIHADTTNETP